WPTPSRRRADRSVPRSCTRRSRSIATRASAPGTSETDSPFWISRAISDWPRDPTGSRRALKSFRRYAIPRVHPGGRKPLHFMKIHPTAVIHPGAELAESVEVQPYAIIGPRVRIGADTVVGPHVVIDGDTVIGERNRLYSGAQ